eukprot:CAMPEP_0181190122 /NCGR_PEP_ID=MMETSP1096-20121128/12021_1 /TAXON_ID=156174 ORGANISM="Chrysochromulina ericina, Strain CCMP281" /NCGR_SAMPLE_ID=MMETSP1096 /ASSEMBLY_ACC=CAM_ASM_000453 /LENGTH=120 /DNA_ID=CAMNT_0023279309 /DNA_START=314 /DNA_END=676 /DNA_ORIENTATION=-
MISFASHTNRLRLASSAESISTPVASKTASELPKSLPAIPPTAALTDPPPAASPSVGLLRDVSPPIATSPPASLPTALALTSNGGALSASTCARPIPAVACRSVCARAVRSNLTGLWTYS